MNILFDGSVEDLVRKQVSIFWGDIPDISQYQVETLERLEYCFTNCANKYFKRDGKVCFDPLNTVQYSIYLWFLSNTIFNCGGSLDACKKLYYLNKVMHSVDWYYEISFPAIFSMEHPLGSVMGRAVYSNKFFFYQNCTVGGSGSPVMYPIIGENVIMYAHSTILGCSKIGNNVILGCGTLILNETIPDNCFVFGQSPNLTIKQKSTDYILEKTSRFWLLP